MIIELETDKFVSETHDFTCSKNCRVAKVLLKPFDKHQCGFDCIIKTRNELQAIF